MKGMDRYLVHSCAGRLTSYKRTQHFYQQSLIHSLVSSSVAVTKLKDFTPFFFYEYPVSSEGFHDRISGRDPEDPPRTARTPGGERRAEVNFLLIMNGLGTCSLIAALVVLQARCTEDVGWPWYELISARPVKEVEWLDIMANSSGGSSKQPSISRRFFDEGLPAVIKNHPAAQWEVAKWTPEVVEKKVGMLRNVYVGEDEVFLYYHDDKDLSNVLRQHEARGWQPQYDLQNMSTVNFFSQCRQLSESSEAAASLARSPSSGNPFYYYYSGDLDVWDDDLDEVGDLRFEEAPITRDVPVEEARQLFGIPDELRNARMQ
eukprot:jgi/Bigna1/68209/fgenesh1_pg.5_\